MAKPFYFYDPRNPINHSFFDYENPRVPWLTITHDSVKFHSVLKTDDQVKIFFSYFLLKKQPIQFSFSLSNYVPSLMALFNFPRYYLVVI